MHATIFHNPACGTSRDTLALIRNSGVEPEVIDYLASPPTRDRLRQLIAAAQVGVREAIRAKEPAYAELGLDNPALSDDDLLDAMLAHPVLIQRPIVETSKGTRICRPAELVLELL